MIPKIFLLGSIEQRKALLNGLMDTDGCSHKNRISYSTMSLQLAKDVQTLVQSLGGTAIIRSTDRTKDNKGTEYSVNVKTFFNPFSCSRKAKEWKYSSKNPPSRYITEITKDTYQEYKEKVSGVRKTELKNARDRIKKNRKEALKPPDNLSFTQKMAFLAEQADYYPQKIDELLRWDDILVPHGWRFINEGTEGRRLWSRPGGDYRKSAVTDWEGSEGNVMSLMSTSRETGLLDLLEAHIPLTKERVLLRLSFNDQYELMTDWIDSLIE